MLESRYAQRVIDRLGGQPVDCLKGDMSKASSISVDMAGEISSRLKNFARATGIFVGIYPAGWGMTFGEVPCMSPLCASLLRRAGLCAHCKCIEQRILRQVTRTRVPVHMVCYAGVHTMVIPVMAHGSHVATIWAGGLPAHSFSARNRRALSRRFERLWHEQVPGVFLKRWKRTPCPGRRRVRAIMKVLESAAGQMGVEFEKQMAQQQNLIPSLRARSYVDSRFNSPLSQSEVAKRIGVSRQHLARIWRRDFGHPFIEYLHKRRVAYACELLGQNSRKIIDIALECGFGSLSQFNRIFLRIEGITPGTYRARCHIPELK
jgi:AraC-like DNA-binding protein/ligand-binding sensor protein